MDLELYTKLCEKHKLHVVKACSIPVESLDNVNLKAASRLIPSSINDAYSTCPPLVLNPTVDSTEAKKLMETWESVCGTNEQLKNMLELNTDERFTYDNNGSKSENWTYTYKIQTTAPVDRISILDTMLHNFTLWGRYDKSYNRSHVWCCPQTLHCHFEDLGDSMSFILRCNSKMDLKDFRFYQDTNTPVYVKRIQCSTKQQW